MPTLRAFEVLVAIADEGSLTRAATALNMTQPAVSHQVAALEAELGVTVIDRTPKGVSLTVAGRAFLGPARETLRQARVAVQNARAGTAAEPLRVVTAESFTIPVVSRAVQRWYQQGNALPALAETTSAEQALASLRRGEHDLAVLPGPLEAPDLTAEQLGIERIVVVGVGDGRTPVAVPELADEPVVSVHDDNGFALWLRAQLPVGAAADRPGLRTRSVQSAAALADAGFGVTVVPETAVPSGVERSPLSPPLTRPVVALWRGEGAPPLLALVDLLRQATTSALAATAETAL